MNNTDKPLLKDFLKVHLIPFYWWSKFICSKGSNYIEKEKTKNITRIIIMIYGFLILFFDLADSGIKILILLTIGIVLDVIHWLYAKFDKVEHNDN